MTPASKIDSATYDVYAASRLKAVEDGCTVASHWPHVWIDFKLKKRTAKEIHRPIVLTPDQRALVVGDQAKRQARAATASTS